MCKSRQRLGDDPRDYDGHVKPFEEEYSDVSGVRPDTPFPHDAESRPENGPEFEPWRIYPKPPPPHWQWKDKTVVTADGYSRTGCDFDMEDCIIPGPQEGWSFALDEKGVYQVYDETEGALHISHFNTTLILVRRE